MQYLALDQVCFVVMRARQVDVVDPVRDDEDSSNAIDDGFAGAVGGGADDATSAELTSFIDDLDVDRQAEMVALTWVGRGDYAIEEWAEAVRLARERQTGPTSAYLLGEPLLSDYLTEGLAAFGMSCTDMDDVTEIA